MSIVQLCVRQPIPMRFLPLAQWGIFVDMQAFFCKKWQKGIAHLYYSLLYYGLRLKASMFSFILEILQTIHKKFTTSEYSFEGCDKSLYSKLGVTIWAHRTTAGSADPVLARLCGIP